MISEQIAEMVKILFEINDTEKDLYGEDSSTVPPAKTPIYVGLARAFEGLDLAYGHALAFDGVPGDPALLKTEGAAQ